MARKFTKMICTSLALIMAFSLVACGNTAPEETDASKAADTTKASDTTAAQAKNVKLKIYAQYSDDSEKKPYDYAVAAMKKAMPNVELDLEVEAQDDNQKIKTYAAAGALPDVFKVTSDLVVLFKKSNNLLQLDSYAKEAGIEDKLNPSSIPLLKDADGHIYAVPNVGQWAANLFINKELFAQNNIKVPTNYAELLDAVKAFKAKNILPLSIFAKEKWPGVQLFDMLASREEPTGFLGLDTGKTKISDAAYKKAADRVVELVKAGLISKDAFNTTYDQAASMFLTGKAAMMINGSWMMVDAGDAKNLGEKVDILYSAPFADADKVEGTKWNMSGGGFNQGFAVDANSKNKDIAAKFAVQFAMAYAEGRVVKCGDPNPIMKNPPQPEAGYNTVQKKYVADSANFKTMTAFDWGITNPKVKVALEDGVQKLMTGQYPVDKFLQDVDKASK